MTTYVVLDVSLYFTTFSSILSAILMYSVVLYIAQVYIIQRVQSENHRAQMQSNLYMTFPMLAIYGRTYTPIEHVTQHTGP